MERYRSFEAFWPFYLSQHLNPVSRGLHFGGTCLALGTVASAVALADPRLVPAALVAGYGPAWVGHFFFEKNRPATFQYPLWSLRGDFRMAWRMLRGALGPELERARKLK